MKKLILALAIIACAASNSTVNAGLLDWGKEKLSQGINAVTGLFGGSSSNQEAAQ